MNVTVPAPVLRASVGAFRDPNTPAQDKADIQAWWESLGIPNQFAAMLRAAELEKARA